MRGSEFVVAGPGRGRCAEGVIMRRVNAVYPAQESNFYLVMDGGRVTGSIDYSWRPVRARWWFRHQ